MKPPSLRLGSLQVDCENPWGDDVLGRKEIADVLTKTVIEEKGPLTIALHGIWGSGKTYLLRRWRAESVNAGMQVIYFCAWEDDYCVDPLIALFGQLENEFQGEKWASVRKKLMGAAATLCGHLLRSGVSAASNGFLDLDADALQSETGKILKSYGEARASRVAVLIALEHLAAKVKQETGRPLVMVIDELDRCRPSFAVELLERVKHVLDVPNLVVIYGVDRDQLGVAIQSCYGPIAVDGYLARFFDLEVGLSQVDVVSYCRHLVLDSGLGAFVNERAREANINGQANEFSTFMDCFPILCQGLGYTLREVERATQKLIWVLRGTPPKNSFHPILLSVLMALRARNPELSGRFLRGNALPGEVLDWLFGSLEEGALKSLEDGKAEHIEVQVYATDMKDDREDRVLQSLDALIKDGSKGESGFLSSRTLSLDQSALGFLRRHYAARRNAYPSFLPTHQSLRYLDDRLQLSDAIE